MMKWILLGLLIAQNSPASARSECRILLYCRGVVSKTYDYWTMGVVTERTLNAISIPVDTTRPMPTMLEIWKANQTQILKLEKQCNQRRYAQTPLSPYDPSHNYPSPMDDPWRQDTRLMWVVPKFVCSTGGPVDVAWPAASAIE